MDMIKTYLSRYSQKIARWFSHCDKCKTLGRYVDFPNAYPSQRKLIRCSCIFGKLWHDYTKVYPDMCYRGMEE